MSRGSLVLRLSAIPVLPGLYLIAMRVFAPGFWDKVIVMLLLLLSIGLLFPDRRGWVARFLARLPGTQDRDRTSPPR